VFYDSKILLSDKTIKFNMPDQIFRKIFGKKPIIGMIHLAGEDPIERALEEIQIYEEEGLSGILIEDYHSSIDEVINLLEQLENEKLNLKIGVSILDSKLNATNEFRKTLKIAEIYKIDFVKLDYVSGTYYDVEFPVDEYFELKKNCPNILILAGVQPKYFTATSNLDTDLKQGMERANALIVTDKKSEEVPLERIQYFRKIMANHPLIIGARLKPTNAYERLIIADGAIVGASLKKDYNTRNKVCRDKVRALMNVVDKVLDDQGLIN